MVTYKLSLYKPPLSSTDSVHSEPQVMASYLFVQSFATYRVRSQKQTSFEVLMYYNFCMYHTHSLKIIQSFSSILHFYIGIYGDSLSVDGMHVMLV